MAQLGLFRKGNMYRSKIRARMDASDSRGTPGRLLPTRVHSDPHRIQTTPALKQDSTHQLHQLIW